MKAMKNRKVTDMAIISNPFPDWVHFQKQASIMSVLVIMGPAVKMLFISSLVIGIVFDCLISERDNKDIRGKG